MSEQSPPISVVQNKDIRIVEFTSTKILDEANITEIGNTLTHMIDEVNNPKLLLDFSNVDHLSSAALGMLINANNRIKTRNGQLRLTNIRPQIPSTWGIRSNRENSWRSRRSPTSTKNTGTKNP